MERISRLTASLADLDAFARAQVAAAAAEGLFDEVALLTPLAKEIGELTKRWDTSMGSSTTSPFSHSRTEEDQPQEKLADPITPRQEQLRRKSSYPQFIREKGDLVKLGWSPQDKAPYEHRVPKPVVDATCRAVYASGRAGHRFRMNEVAKGAAKGAGNASLPSYLVYAVVSWLKWAGMIIQHGRQGYTIVRPQSFSTSVEAAWLALPQR